MALLPGLKAALQLTDYYLKLNDCLIWAEQILKTCLVTTTPSTMLGNSSQIKHWLASVGGPEVESQLEHVVSGTCDEYVVRKEYMARKVFNWYVLTCSDFVRMVFSTLHVSRQPPPEVLNQSFLVRNTLVSPPQWWSQDCQMYSQAGSSRGCDPAPCCTNHGSPVHRSSTATKTSLFGPKTYVPIDRHYKRDVCKTNRTTPTANKVDYYIL